MPLWCECMYSSQLLHFMCLYSIFMVNYIWICSNLFQFILKACQSFRKKNGAESNWKFQHRIQLTHANVYQTRVWWPHAHELCVSNEIPLNVLCTHYTLDTRFFPRLVSFFCSIQSMNGAQFYLEFISQLENASRVWFFSDGDDSNIIIKCCYTRFFFHSLHVYSEQKKQLGHWT